MKTTGRRGHRARSCLKRKESEEKASSNSAGSADSNAAGGEDADMARAAAIISAHQADRAPSRRRPLLTSSFSQHQHEDWLASLEPERYMCVCAE